MSAADTAERVLAWAARGARGAPPRGDLAGLAALAAPDARLRAALATLAQVTAARLRLASPPRGRLGLDALLLAAAVGGRGDPARARALVAAVRPADGDALEEVARHGLVGPAWRRLGEGEGALAAELLRASPLTLALDRPPESVADATAWTGDPDASQAEEVADRWLADRATRRATLFALGAPARDPAVLAFRAWLLDGLRAAPAPGPERVLDVYEAALTYHGAAHLAQVDAATATLAGDAPGEAELALALAAAAWWGPLAALDRSDPGALRAREGLGYAYLRGCRLHRLARRLAAPPLVPGGVA